MTVYQDRIVDKVQTRTVTKPNGTKIVTETKIIEKQTYHKDSKVVSSSQHQPRYSLGIDLRAEQWGIGHRAYDVQLGYRIGDLPLWQTLTISTDKSVAIGLRLEF